MVNTLISRLRNMGRRMNIGVILLKMQQSYKIGFYNTFKSAVCKRKYLSLILRMKPIDTGDSGPQVHMLLHHRRAYEGIWCLYSLAYFSGGLCKLVVHSDGTLDKTDVENIHRILPGSVVVLREDADTIASEYFRKNNLYLCDKMRKNFVLGIKLFDPILLCEAEDVIVIDSDVLFFARPDEILNPSSILPKYSLDMAYAYSLSEEELRKLLDRDCIDNCNTGIVRINPKIFSFARVEVYLQHKGFWKDDFPVDWFVEQTLYALELTKLNAVPFSPDYMISPQLDSDANIVSGHYCGGPGSAFKYYTEAIPHLYSVFTERQNNFSPRN